MHARLCMPGPCRPKGLQVLVHGITYSGDYWDPGPDFADNSYVAAAVSAGYATLAVDRIGYGRSSRTPVRHINYRNQSWQLHQIVAHVRRGGLGTRFDSVVYVGHSSGTALTWAAAEFHDVDAVIATGMLHGVSLRGLVPVASGLVGRGPRAGYLSTRPGTRAALFHGPGVDARLVAHDESTKDGYTLGEFVTGLSSIYGTASRDVDVPVLMVVGARDRLVCGPPLAPPLRSEQLLNREARYYRPGLPLEAFVLPAAGHSINFAPNAQRWFEHAQTWLDAALGAT